MKIEKISDNQIRFILNKEDLQDRGIKLAELAHGSLKAQELFFEMMEQANEEHGFEADRQPLMIEAIPINKDSIMIIVTKVDNTHSMHSKLNLFDIFEPESSDAFFGKKVRRGKPPVPSKVQFKRDTKEGGNSNSFLFCFENLDNVMLAAKRMLELNLYIGGLSQVYKNDERYFLFLNGGEFKATLGSILCEYGKEYFVNNLTRGYIAEHGEIIIKEHAIEKLGKL